MLSPETAPNKGMQATAYSLRLAVLGSGFPPRLMPGVRCQREKIGMRHALLYDAVIFDWFGTLTLTMSWAKVERAADDVADALGIARDVFRHVWLATNTARDLGMYATFDATIAYVCAACSVVVTPLQMAQARARRLTFLREALTLRDDAIETLHRLRRQGLRIGLISDASFEDVALWPETPLAGLVDAALFSCREGVKKPDPQLYQRMGEQLAVSLTRCLYVGDGGSNELAGAAGVGMHALRIAPSHAIPGGVYRPGGASWHGPTIARLSTLPSLVTRGSI